MSNDLRHLSPSFTIDEAKVIALEYYGLNEFVCQLPSERDQNFLFRRDEFKFILKISNIDENYSVLDMQNNAISYINNGIRCLSTLDGKMISSYKNHFVRLVNYLPGIPLADYRPHSSQLIFNLGKVLGKIDKSLREFEHESAKRYLYWDMKNAENIVNKYKHLIVDSNHRQIIEIILQDWMKFVIPYFSSLRISIIHNDANDYNIIVIDQDNLNLIDFGDMCQTFTISEPAIACAYIMLDKDNPINSAKNLLEGYNQIYPLESIEIELIYYFIRMRLAMSVTISAHQKEAQPDNHYLTITEKSAWTLLEKLTNIDTQFVNNTFQSINNNHFV
jgi:Ser/Thr protein kinase RdoA (MazF antagonist)